MKNSLSEIPALAARLLAQVSSSSGSSIVVRICHNYGLFERLLPKNTYFSANCMLRMLMPAADRADHAECVRHTGWFRILNAPNAARLNHAGIGLLGFGLISSHSRQTLLVVVFLSRDSYGAVREPEHRSYTDRAITVAAQNGTLPGQSGCVLQGSGPLRRRPDA